MKEFRGGKLVGWGAWPIKATIDPSYRPISRFRFEAYDGGLPFIIIARADSLNYINYTPAALYFWTSTSIQSDLHRCSREIEGASQIKGSAEMIVEALRGRVFSDSIKIIFTKPQPNVEKCLRRVFANRLLLRGIPEKLKRIKLKYKLHFFAKKLPEFID